MSMDVNSSPSVRRAGDAGQALDTVAIDKGKSVSHDTSGSALVIANPITKDKVGSDKSTYTSFEELADKIGANDSFRGQLMQAPQVGAGSSDVGGLDPKKNQVTNKNLVKSIAKFEKLLRKLITDGDKTVDALRTALSLAISGVASFQAGHQIVDTSLVKSNIESLSKIGKQEVLSMTSPSEVAKTSQQVVSLGLAISAKATKTQDANRASRYQQQPKDSFNETTTKLYNSIHNGIEVLNNLSNDKNQLASHVTIGS